MPRPLRHIDHAHDGPACGTVLYRGDAKGDVTIVAADHGISARTGEIMPPDPRFPCWMVMCGHDRLADGKKWLTQAEVDALGGWEHCGNVHDLIAPGGRQLRPTG